MENHAERITYLDAVRGIAALFVVVSHVIASHWDWVPAAKVALMFFNGNDAVSIFFVLSGLVLSYKIFQTDAAITPNYYKRFAVARLFRLYPAFLVMIVIYYICLHHGDSFINLWNQTLLHNPHYFWEEAILIRGHHDHFFPGWTLGVEVAMSLLVPFLVIISRQNIRLLAFLLIVCVVIGWLYVSEFLLHFGLGILIAQQFNYVLKYQESEKWWFKNRFYLFPAILLIYMSFHYVLTYSWPPSLQYFMKSILHVSEYFFSGVMSAIILLFVINSTGLRRFFSFGLFNFLGKISYGVYLSHWLFTNYTMANFENLKQQFAGGYELVFFFEFLIGTIACSILAGILLHYMVERPFIRWGKSIAARI